jgi:hypothetical protein
MPFTLYDHVDTAGKNDFKEWTESLQKTERAKLNQALDRLAMNGTVMRPHALAGTGIGGIEKLRVRGSTQLRPLLTDGPINTGSEFTLLFGAREVGDKWKPKDAPATAQQRKQELIKSPNLRRKPHERVS